MYIIVYIYISDIHRKSNSLWLVGLILTDLPLPIVGGRKTKPVRTHSSTACNHQPSGNKSAVIFQSVPLPITPINCPQICVNLKITKPWFLRVSGVRGLGLWSCSLGPAMRWGAVGVLVFGQCSRLSPRVVRLSVGGLVTPSAWWDAGAWTMLQSTPHNRSTHYREREREMYEGRAGHDGPTETATERPIYLSTCLPISI